MGIATIIATIFTLLVIFQIKHFVADFLLQVPIKYMLGKFKSGWDFVLPLAAHCAVHGYLTLIICLYYDKSYWWLAVVDFVVHFLVDRLKAGPKYFGRFKSLSANEMIPLIQKHKAGLLSIEDKKLIRDNGIYYITLGLDQMLHSLTHYFIIYMLVQSMNEFVVFTNFALGVMFLPLIVIAKIFWLFWFFFAVYRFVKMRLSIN
jgi:hypothetical protein